MPAVMRTRPLAEWSLRPWVLSALLGLAGLAIYLLTHEAENSGIRMALAGFVGIAAIAFAFTLDRAGWRAPAIYSAAVGLVIGGLVWRAVGQSDDLAAEEFGLMAGVFAAGLSLPLFQAGFHRRLWRTSYAETHYHVWTDAISAGGALAFTGLSWIVLFLVSQLLDLVGIRLEDIIQREWFAWTFSGASFGAALGVLRNQLKIVGTLQSLVLTVFSLLAVPVALVIVVFLVAVVVSGPSVLWDATDSSTPLLLAIAGGAFILVNAVIRDDARSMSANPALKTAARVLALGILPLTIFAAISMGVRIGQHGLSPERLWGLAAIVVAVAYGVAYFIGCVRGWKRGWPARLRAANLRLAVGTAVYALLLALPILNFGAVSTAHQLGRLDSGAVSVDEFDFNALRWDFGEPGRAALDRLIRSGDEAIARAAKQARARPTRPYDPFDGGEARGADAEERRANLQIVGADPDMASAIRAYVGQGGLLCRSACRALVVGPHRGGTLVALTNGSAVEYLLFDEEGIATVLYSKAGRLSDEWEAAEREPFGPEDEGGRIEIRPYSGRQLYIDGRPVGEPFE